MGWDGIPGTPSSIYHQGRAGLSQLHLQKEERPHLSHVLGTWAPSGSSECPTLAVAAPGGQDLCPYSKSQELPWPVYPWLEFSGI